MFCPGGGSGGRSGGRFGLASGVCVSSVSIEPATNCSMVGRAVCVAVPALSRVRGLDGSRGFSILSEADAGPAPARSVAIPSTARVGCFFFMAAVYTAREKTRVVL